MFQWNHIKHLHQFPTIIQTPKNIPTVIQKESCNFATENINPMSMQPSTDNQENLHMTPNFITADTNTTTNKSKIASSLYNPIETRDTM